MQELNRVLATIEERIDLKHISQVEKLHCDTLDYKEVPLLPLTLVFPLMDNLTPFPYSEAFEDPKKMLYNELLVGWGNSSIYNSVHLKDCFPLHIRSNHGIGILSSLFGAKCRIINDNMPWLDHLEKEEVKKIMKAGVPDFNKALGGKVIENHHLFLHQLKKFPNCYQSIRVSQPDLQGPFDIAHLLLGDVLFYDLYDSPDFVHELLDLITETYIGYRTYIDNLLTDRAGDDNAIYVHGSIYGGKVILKDDLALINISQQMYDEFSKPYNERILEAFEGGSIHYCGTSKDWHLKCINSDKLMGINYGNPEMIDLKEAYEYWSREKVPIIYWGYNQGYDFMKKLAKLNITTGITLATQADSYAHAREILDEHNSLYL